MHTPVSLTPMNIHTLTVRNRFVLPGMVTDMAVDGGYVTERLLSYYEERAKGGVGLVIVEATSIDVSGKTFLHGLDISDDRFIPGLRLLGGTRPLPRGRRRHPAPARRGPRASRIFPHALPGHGRHSGRV